VGIKIGDEVCVRANKDNYFRDFHGTVVGIEGGSFIIQDSDFDTYLIPQEHVILMEIIHDDEKGGSLVKKHIECAFVNGLPIKNGKVIGYNVTKDKEKLQSTLVLSIVQEVFYPHPDTTECLLMVKEEKTIMRAVEGDEHYPSLYMLMMAQEIVKRRVS
jgi:hypothetical protein